MLQPSPLHFPGSELFEYNRRLIRTLSPGFTTLWVEDHLQLGETATHECMTTLSYFAGEFPQFHVGSLVLCQSYRNPALTAKMAANLKLLYGGRFIIGLGEGSSLCWGLAGRKTSTMPTGIPFQIRRRAWNN